MSSAAGDFSVWGLVSRTWANFRIVAFWIRHPVEEGFDYFRIVNCCEEPGLGSGDSRLVLFGNVGLGLDTSAVKNTKNMRKRSRWAWTKTIYIPSCLELLPPTLWSSPINPAKRCKRCDAIIQSRRHHIPVETAVLYGNCAEKWIPLPMSRLKEYWDERFVWRGSMLDPLGYLFYP